MLAVCKAYVSQHVLLSMLQPGFCWLDCHEPYSVLGEHEHVEH